jgi:hypothetical protein
MTVHGTTFHQLHGSRTKVTTNTGRCLDLYALAGHQVARQLPANYNLPGLDIADDDTVLANDQGVRAMQGAFHSPVNPHGSGRVYVTGYVEGIVDQRVSTITDFCRSTAEQLHILSSITVRWCSLDDAQTSAGEHVGIEVMRTTISLKIALEVQHSMPQV